MRRVDARTEIEILDEAECLRRLAEDEISRLAVIASGAPMIFPVNYATVDSPVAVPARR